MITIRIRKEDIPARADGPEFVQDVLRRSGGGSHRNRERDVVSGRSRKVKHRRSWLSGD